MCSPRKRFIYPCLKSRFWTYLYCIYLDELQEELRKTLDDKRELSRRVNELIKIKKNLKDKIGQMEKQQEILLKNTNGHKVSELMGYVDKQRNIYRNNVQQLLNKLDPDGRTLQELEENQIGDLG